MQILILKNSKKSFENGNETKALKDSISEIITDKIELSKHFDNKNTELTEKIEELSKGTKEDMMSFSKNFVTINQELTDAKKRTHEVMISLKNENEDLKINNKRMNEEIISLKGDLSSMKAIIGFKVCTLQAIFLLQLLIYFH